MHKFLIVIVIPSCQLSCDKKPLTGAGSDVYNKDKAYYEGFKDPYTYADGSCVNGCEKMNSKCVPKDSFFLANYHGFEVKFSIPKSKKKPNFGYGLYWKRNIDEIPNVFPQYFEILSWSDPGLGFDPYYYSGNYKHFNIPNYTTLSSGYEIVQKLSYNNTTFNIEAKRRIEGDTFYTCFPAGKNFTDPVFIQKGQERYLGFIRGKFSPDFKKMNYYWDYYHFKIDYIGDSTLVFFQRINQVTLDYH